MTSDDLAKVADVFLELSRSSRGPDNPIFRFETPWSTHTQDSPIVQSRYFSQIDVTAIEMIASGKGVHARVYIDLEEGPALPQEPNAPNVIRSRIEIEGDEKAVFDLWSDLNAIVEPRRSQFADFMNATPIAIVVLLATLMVVMLPPLLTAQRLHLSGDLSTLVTVGTVVITFVIGAGIIALHVPSVLWPRVAIQGWGRLERSRATFQWWTGGIALALVSWAIGLAILGVWGQH
jgi:hypothetical protein